MAKSVVVYSAEWCPWCHRVTDFLKQNRVEFTEKNVEEGENARECMEKSGQGGIPVTIIDGVVLVGYDEKKLRELLGL